LQAGEIRPVSFWILYSCRNTIIFPRRDGSFFTVDLGKYSLNPIFPVFLAFLFIKSQRCCSIPNVIFEIYNHIAPLAL
jgi:hypothetical protein